ncbi:MAG TPA: hypothetical protein VJ828_20230 [Lacipirellulaceae bacterium]|nr:hypothetical protein [Lacipirellulaceae bacterium]
MSSANAVITWAGVEDAGIDIGGTWPEDGASEFLGRPADDELSCATDPFDDFDDDDFDDEFDDDFEEEWDEELPGDADQFEPDPVEAEDADDGLPVEPDFEDED